MHAHAVANVPADVTSNSSMSDEDFFKWLKSMGIGEKDHKALSGKINCSHTVM